VNRLATFKQPFLAACASLLFLAPLLGHGSPMKGLSSLQAFTELKVLHLDYVVRVEHTCDGLPLDGVSLWLQAGDVKLMTFVIQINFLT
jgi:hypothetical protein